MCTSRSIVFVCVRVSSLTRFLCQRDGHEFTGHRRAPEAQNRSFESPSNFNRAPHGVLYATNVMFTYSRCLFLAKLALVLQSFLPRGQ
jgi:hypothetical protein